MINIKTVEGSMGGAKLNSLRDACRKSFHETSLCGLTTALYDVQLLISVVKCDVSKNLLPLSSTLKKEIKGSSKPW